MLRIRSEAPGFLYSLYGIERELHRAEERVMLRGRRATERRERFAHRAAVDVVLREQPARESARRSFFETEPSHDRRDKAGKLGCTAVQNIDAHRVPLRRALQHERRKRGDIALAAVGKIDKIEYAPKVPAADSIHHRGVERVFRKTAVLGLERCGERVPAERIASPRIVDDMSAAAAAKKLPGGVFAAAD